MVSTVGDAGLTCAGQAVAAGLPDGLAASFVFVVGGDIPDRGVQPDPVVFEAALGEFGVEFAGIADVLQVRPFAFDVPEQRLDPGLILGLSG